MPSKKITVENLLRKIILEIAAEEGPTILWHKQMGKQAEWHQELLDLAVPHLPHRVTSQDIVSITVEWLDNRNAYNLSVQLDPDLYMRDADVGFVRKSEVTRDLWSQFEVATGRGQALSDIHPRKEGLVTAVETAVHRTVASLKVSDVVLRHLEVHRKIHDATGSEGLRVELQVSVPSHEASVKQKAITSVWREFRSQLKLRGADIVKYSDRLGRSRDISSWTLDDPKRDNKSREEFAATVPYSVYIEEIAPKDFDPSSDLEGEDSFRF